MEDTLAIDTESLRRIISSDVATARSGWPSTASIKKTRAHGFGSRFDRVQCHMSSGFIRCRFVSPDEWAHPWLPGRARPADMLRR